MNRPKGMNFRRCKECKRILHVNKLKKNKNSKYGVVNMCKECYSEYNKKYNKEHKEEKSKKNKEYNKEHIEEKSKKNKEYYKEHIEYFEQNRENNKEYYKEYRKEWYNNNKEHVKEYNKEYSKEYRKNNPHIFFNASSRRREKLESQGRGITKEQWFEMMEFFNWGCAYSGIQLTKENRSIDHIVALDNNGENEPWNCVPMYLNYNSSKKDNYVLDWYMQQEYFNIERLTKIYEWRIYAYEKWGKETV